ncbi:MAG TPA: nuclear transport factor 2 family protein [Usitatibacter sp.]|nr:nuclear transport factor 2 family protein [Usitatibacter sp.]
MQATLERLNEEFIAAVRNSDVVWFQRNLAPDYTNRNSAGKWETLQEFLAVNARPFQLRDFRASEVQIRMVGNDVALVHGKTQYVNPDGSPGRGRYVDVWQRSDGAWRCVSADVMRG